MSEIKNVPKLRFPEFTDDWEQRKLPEIVTFYNGLTYSPKDVKEFGTLVLRSSNVKNGEIIDADNVYVNPNVATSEQVKYGDIIMVVRNGSRALIGKHALIKDSMPNTVIGAFMTGIRSNYNKFVNALLNTSTFEKEIKKNMGATINQITGYMFSQMDFFVPSECEQDKIGEYFDNLDNLIIFHQRKYDSMLEYKKAMLQKMFPKDGETVPEIRFPGFDGEWEEKKFGQIVNLRRGLTYKPSNVSTEGVRVLRSSNIKEDTFVFGNEDVFVNPDVVKIDKAKNNDILITSANGSSSLIGKHTLIKNLPDNSAVHGGFMLLGSTENPYFINASMSSVWYKNFIDYYVAGGNGAIGNLNKSDLDNQNILVPSNEEQQKIGLFFKNLDEQIDLQKQKIELIKEYKKGLLQQMFI